MSIAPLDMPAIRDAADEYMSTASPDAFDRVVQGLLREIEWICRNFQYGPAPAKKFSGGGKGASPVTIREVAVINFLSDNMAVPGQPVVFSGVHRDLKRVYAPVYPGATIQLIKGTIEVEGSSAGDKRFLVSLYPVANALSVAPGNRIGFSVGFKRATAGADAGRFFVQVSQYAKETSNPNPAEIVNEIPMTSSLFVSDDVILDASFLADYETWNSSSGIGGLRFSCDLRVYG